MMQAGIFAIILTVLGVYNWTGNDLDKIIGVICAVGAVVLWNIQIIINKLKEKENADSKL